VGQTVAVFGHSDTCGLRPRLHGGNGRCGDNPGDPRQALTRMSLFLAAVLAEFANQTPRRIRN
jgi:hypothetical protein